MRGISNKIQDWSFKIYVDLAGRKIQSMAVTNLKAFTSYEIGIEVIKKQRNNLKVKNLI